MACVAMAVVHLLHLLFRHMWGHASTARQRASTSQPLLQVRVLLQQRGLLLLLLLLALALRISQDVQQLSQLLRAPPGSFFTPWLLLLLRLLQLLRWRCLQALLLLLLVSHGWHAAADGGRHVARASWRTTHRHHAWAAVALRRRLLLLLHVPASWRIPQLLLLLVADPMRDVWRQHATLLLHHSRHVALRHLMAACISTLLLLVHAAAAASAAGYAG
jgi:hypothetical protein